MITHRFRAAARTRGVFVAALCAVAVTTACSERSTTRSARELAVARIAGQDLDLTPLDAIVGEARYVNVGEDSHGMPGVHQFVADAFKYLATTKGFRVFVFESAWGIEAGLQDFLNSDRTAVEGDENLFLNAFNSPSTIELLIWIRKWNRTHPDDPIRIAGYQPEQPVTDFAGIWRYLEPFAPFADSGLKERAVPCRAGSGRHESNMAFIVESTQRRRAGQATYSATDRAACLAALTAIGKFLDEHREALTDRSSGNAFREAKLRVLSLEAYVGVLTRVADEGFDNQSVSVAEQFRLQGEAYMGGDRARDQIWATLMQTRYSGMKVFFWMHNWHAARRASELNRTNTAIVSIPFGTISLGERLAQRYGRELVTIGNIVPCDATCTEPAGSLEPPFAERFDQAMAIIDLRQPGSEARGLPLSTPGWLYGNHHKLGFGDVVLDRQFDALFYLAPEVAGNVRTAR